MFKGFLVVYADEGVTKFDERENVCYKGNVGREL